MDPGYEVAEDDVVIKPTGKYKWLSDMYPMDIIIDDKLFPSVENYLQYCRLEGSVHRDKFITMSPKKARKLGMSMKKDAIREITWKKNKDMYVMNAYLAKYIGTELELPLLETYPNQIELDNYYLLDKIRYIIIKEKINVT